MDKLANQYYFFQNNLLDRASCLSSLAPLLLRLYLIPIFWMAGTNKIDLSTFMPYQGTVDWFGDYLGLPIPTVMAFLAGWTEILGAIFFAAGFAVRWISLPLMITMLVAAFAVHWGNGWQAISDVGSAYANERVEEAAARLIIAKDILRQHGDYRWLTAKGSLVILNNGIEFSITYFLMLLSLFFTGGGKYVGIDYWLSQRFPQQ